MTPGPYATIVLMKALVLLFPAVLALAQSPFKLEKTVPLPGVEGRIDHLAIDLKDKRLLVAALENNTVEVVDIAAAARLASLAGMNEPQGTAYSPDSRKIYVANGKDGKVRIFDAATAKPAGEITVGEDTDNLRYEAARKLLWVGWADGVLTAINVANGQRAGNDIYLDAHPESFQLEKAGPRIFVNVPDAGEIEVVDRVRRVILDKWHVKTGAANFPMALDEANHRMFVACRKPAKILVWDTESAKVITEFPCPGDSDDVFYDAARKRLYVAGGEGFLEAFQQNSPDQYQSLGKIATAFKARTAIYVPDLNRLFLAVPHMPKGSQTAEVRIYQVE
jgi:WD40 repeat protein